MILIYDSVLHLSRVKYYRDVPQGKIYIKFNPLFVKISLAEKIKR